MRSIFSYLTCDVVGQDMKEGLRMTFGHGGICAKRSSTYHDFDHHASVRSSEATATERVYELRDDGSTEDVRGRHKFERMYSRNEEH